MKTLTDAEKAWIMYRDFGPNRNLPRRTLRKREFIEGFMRGVLEERKRTKEVVLPVNLRLYDLLRQLQADPELLAHLQAEIPLTIQTLVHRLKGSS